MKHAKSDLRQGTLDLLILRTLAAGDMHGWGISQRLQRISQDVLQGSLYPALHRLEQQGWIESSWGDSENNRRAKFYALTRSSVVRMIVRQGLTPVTIGLGCGLAGARLMIRVVARLLFAVEPTDPITYTAVITVLAAVAFLASGAGAARGGDRSDAGAPRRLA